MPWAIRKVRGAKPYEVYNEQNGRGRGRSATLAQAKKHLAAMYANVPEARSVPKPNSRKR